MEAAGCRFVVASGNQYYQLRDLFPDCAEKLAFVAENGALVKDREELVFAASIPRQTVDYVIDVCREYPEVKNVLCGLHSAYCQRGTVSQAFLRGTVSQAFFDLTHIYYHRLQWVDDFKAVEDQILKFPPAATAPST